MSRKKKTTDAPANATPFFARYLEGQDGPATGSAKVGGRKELAHKTAKAPLATLKYPSDKDEFYFYPYYTVVAEVPGYKPGKKVTLKYPSDSDEERYDVNYPSLEDVPKTTTVKTKSSTTVTVKRKK